MGDKSKGRRVPSHLSKDAKGLWRRLTGEFSIEDEAGIALLTVAMEAFDRMKSASSAISEHGVLIKDKFGQLKPNPACAVERDARSQYLMALKQLQLDPNSVGV